MFSQYYYNLRPHDMRNRPGGARTGTGGTLSGAGKYLVEVNPRCHVVCVEPTEARVLTGAGPKLHGVVSV
jgi:cysteine synthase A